MFLAKSPLTLFLLLPVATTALFINATDTSQQLNHFFSCDSISSLSPPVAELSLQPVQTRGQWTETPLSDAVSFRNSSRDLSLFLAPSSGALAAHLAHWSRLHAHPSAPRFAGWCVRSRPQMSFLLRESLISWHEMTLRPMPWCARLHAAVTAAALVAFLEHDWAPTQAKSHARSAVFCDMQTHHWAFRPHTFDLVLIANEALHFADSVPIFAERCVPGAKSACTSKCMTRFHDSLRAPIAEFACDHSGFCHGFDPALNVFALCKTVLVPLLNEDVLIHGEAPQSLVDEIHTSVIRRCLALHKRDRPSGQALYSRLRSLATQYAGSCMNEHHFVRSPLYYDLDAPQRWAAVRDASEAASAHWPPMTVVGGDVGQAPQRSGFRHSDDSTDTAEARVAIAGADTAWLREHNAAKSHNNAVNIEPNDEDLRQIANTALQLRPHQSDAYFRGLLVAEKIAAERKAKESRRHKKQRHDER